MRLPRAVLQPDAARLRRGVVRLPLGAVGLQQVGAAAAGAGGRGAAAGRGGAAAPEADAQAGRGRGRGGAGGGALQPGQFASLEEYSKATGQDRNSVLVDYDVFVKVPKLDRDPK